jgi:CRP-like cAMP-binding protein
MTDGNYFPSKCGTRETECILNDQAVREVLTKEKASKVLSYERGESIFEAGKPIVGFYIVCEGVVREASNNNGEIITLGLYKPGDVIAGDAFFRGIEWHRTTAKSLFRAEIVFLQREIFPHLMRIAGSKVGAKLANNMRHLRRMLELSPRSVLEKTAYWLMRLSRGLAHTFRITNKVLSDIVGCSPVTMSRKLGKLIEEGLIDKNGSEIAILKTNKLRKMASCGRAF